MADVRLTDLAAATSAGPTDWTYLLAGNADRKVEADRLVSRLACGLAGFTLSRATSPVDRVEVAAGACVSSDGTVVIRGEAPFGKRLVAGGWSEGSGLGGLLSGAPQDLTWYDVLALRKTATGGFDVAFCPTGTTPALPTGYGAYRRLGSVLYLLATASVMTFTQCGDLFVPTDATAALTLSTVNPATTPTTLTVLCPPAPGAAWLGGFRGRRTSGSTTARFGPAGLASLWAVVCTSVEAVGTLPPLPAATGTILYSADTNLSWATFQVQSVGWVDPRGK